MGNVFEHPFDVKRSFNICIEAVGCKKIQRFENINFEILNQNKNNEYADFS